jgi:hypothetical protein
MLWCIKVYESLLMYLILAKHGSISGIMHELSLLLKIKSLKRYNKNGWKTPSSF